MNHDGGTIDRVGTQVIATWPKRTFAENLAVDEAGTVFVRLHEIRAIAGVVSLTAGKSGLRGFAYALASKLAADGIQVATVTVEDAIKVGRPFDPDRRIPLR